MRYEDDNPIDNDLESYGLIPLPRPVAAQEKTGLIMNIVNSGYRIEVRAGRDNHFSLEIRNIGTTTLNDILLSSDILNEWNIDFSPAEIQTLGPGNVEIVDVNIRPSLNPTGRIHYIRFFATSGSFQAVQNFEIETKTSSIWLWIVIGISVLVIAAFILVFLRIGKRG